MATILILFIYLSFVSLGLQSPLLGAAWPAAHTALGAPTAAAGIVSTMTTLGTIISSLLSARIIQKLGHGKTAACAVALTATSLMLFSTATSLITFCCIAVPLGLGGGLIDSSINGYVATHYHYRQVNFLHAFWGAGATLGPILLSGYIAAGSWRAGYSTISFIQYAVSALLFCSLPLWKRVSKAEGVEQIKQEYSYRALIHKPGFALALLSFLTYCGAESITSLWASTYLVETQGLSTAAAARAGSLFFAGIVCGRLLCGLFAARLDTRRSIRIGAAAAALGALPLLFNAGEKLQLLGLLLAGLGCGPIYPAFIKLTPERFGVASAQAAIGLEMAADYVGALCLPPLFGLVANRFSFHIYPFVLLALIAATVLLQSPLDRKTGVHATC